MMNSRSYLKLLYAVGMSLFGKKAFDMVGRYAKTEGAKMIISASGAVTGAYVGILVANDIEDMIDNARKAVDDDVEVNNG